MVNFVVRIKQPEEKSVILDLKSKLCSLRLPIYFNRLSMYQSAKAFTSAPKLPKLSITIFALIYMHVFIRYQSEILIKTTHFEITLFMSKTVFNIQIPTFLTEILAQAIFFT